LHSSEPRHAEVAELHALSLKLAVEAAMVVLRVQYLKRRYRLPLQSLPWVPVRLALAMLALRHRERTASP